MQLEDAPDAALVRELESKLEEFKQEHWELQRRSSADSVASNVLLAQQAAKQMVELAAQLPIRGIVHMPQEPVQGADLCGGVHEPPFQNGLS